MIGIPVHMDLERRTCPYCGESDHNVIHVMPSYTTGHGRSLVTESANGCSICNAEWLAIEGWSFYVVFWLLKSGVSMFHNASVEAQNTFNYDGCKRSLS